MNRVGDMEKVKLSIIVPVYNSEQYLEKCIGSILKQTYKEFQLILIDDASTDTSGKICDDIAREDERIKVIHHRENKGLSVSREDGYLLADTEWVSFIDNDDFISPDMYQKLMDYSGEGDLICVRGEDKSNDEIDNAVWPEKKNEKTILTGKEACAQIYSKKMEFGCVGPIWGKLIKRSKIEETFKLVEPYKKKLFWVFFEDVLFMPILFYQSERVVFIDRLMYMHRHIRNNLSSTLMPREYHYESVEAGKVVLSFFKSKGLQEAFDRYLEERFLEVQSTWYKVWKNESNNEKKVAYYKTVGDFYNDYYGYYIKKKRGTGVHINLKKLSILLFKKSRVLWGMTIGNLYFKVLRRYTY